MADYQNQQDVYNLKEKIMSYCSSCGVPIPGGQEICSMCYGDPFYGNDGYYQEWLKEAERKEYYKQQEIEEQMQIEQENVEKQFKKNEK